MAQNVQPLPWDDSLRVVFGREECTHSLYFKKQFLGEMRSSSSVAHRQSVIYYYYEEAARFGSQTVCLDGRTRVTPKRRTINSWFAILCKAIYLE